MENRKFISIFVALGVLVGMPSFAYGYAVSTHANLTEKTFAEYERLYGETFTNEEVERAKKGSMDEDTFESKRRPLNHFYDPINDVGLRAHGALSIPNVTRGLAAPMWAVDTEAQANFLETRIGYTDKLYSSPTDFSWERAVYEYVHGDKKRAIKTLGHIIHLVQDATSPAHVRNDPHLLGDVYEEFTAGMEPSDGMTVDAGRVPSAGSIQNIIEQTAEFTNKNFLSGDTIFKKYPDPNREELELIRIKDGEKSSYFGVKNGLYVVRIKIQRDWLQNNTTETYFLKDGEDIILTDYWEALSKRAVQDGVATIRLFFEAVEKEKKTLALADKNKSEAEKRVNDAKAGLFGVVKSLYGSSVDEQAFEELNPDAAGEQQSAVVAAGTSNTEGNDPPTTSTGLAQEGSGQAPGTTESAGQAETQNDIGDAENTNEADSSGNSSTFEQNSGDATSDNTNTPTPQSNQEGSGEDEADNSNQNTDRQPIIPGGAPVPPSADESSSDEDDSDEQSSGENEQNNTSDEQTKEDNTPPAPPIIAEPTATSTLTKTTIFFSGTAEATSTISTDFSTATTSVDSAGDWALTLSALPQGTTTVQFFATDRAGNTSAATSTTFFIDSETNAPLLSVGTCDDSLAVGSCLVATTTLAAVWSSSATDLDYFFVRFGGSVSITTATSTTFTTSSSTTTSISVSAVDIYGNHSATTTKNISVRTRPIVINEVAWMGTSADHHDEWIELYNPTNADISIDNMVLRASDNKPYILLSGTIPARGYYLLERHDDDTVADVPADHIYGNDGADWAFNNTGEYVVLEHTSSDATTTIDKTLDWDDDCAPNQCGRKSPQTTMERYDAAVSGTDVDNWQTALGEFILNGTTADGGLIRGTPGDKNSISYQIANGTTLTEDKTLTQSESPYLIGRDGLRIAEDTTLTLDPGVVVKIVSANEPKVTVDGTLDARGSSVAPVVFTAFTDDVYGGDMNGDGVCDPDDASSTAACPSAGSWKKIFFTDKSSNSSLAHTIVRYGGRSFSSTQYKTMVAAEDTDLSIANATIEHSSQSGLLAVRTDGSITDSTFRHNNEYSHACGLNATKGSMIIQNNMFTENAHGFCIGDGDITAEGNTAKNNTQKAYEIRGVIGGSIKGNIGSDNGTDGITLSGAITEKGKTATLYTNALPYVVSSDVFVVASSTLYIQPGTTFKFDREQFKVSGALNVLGTQKNPVLFTSVLDDSDGNDATGNGSTTPKVEGQQGIYMQAGSSSDIDHAEFRYMKNATSYDDSPIDLAHVIYEKNDIAIHADAGETIQRADNLTFIGNTATSTIPLK